MTVTITTIYDNELVTHELNNVVAVIKELDMIVFVFDSGASVALNHNNITFTVR